MDGGESGEGMLDVDALSEGSAALGGAAPPPELHEELHLGMDGDASATTSLSRRAVSPQPAGVAGAG